MTNKGRNFIIVNDNIGDYVIEVSSEKIPYGRDVMWYSIYLDPDSGEILGTIKKASSR